MDFFCIYTAARASLDIKCCVYLYPFFFDQVGVHGGRRDEYIRWDDVLLSHPPYFFTEMSVHVIYDFPEGCDEKDSQWCTQEKIDNVCGKFSLDPVTLNAIRAPFVKSQVLHTRERGPEDTDPEDTAPEETFYSGNCYNIGEEGLEKWIRHEKEQDDDKEQDGTPVTDPATRQLLRRFSFSVNQTTILWRRLCRYIRSDVVGEEETKRLEEIKTRLEQLQVVEDVQVDIEGVPEMDLMVAVLSESDKYCEADKNAVNFEKLREVVDLLVKKGVETKVYGPGYPTPLDFAFYMGDEELKNKLIKLGYNRNDE